MNILVCRWDIFVYPDILDTLKNQGHLFDVLDFSAIKMSDDEIKIFSKQLECKITSKYDAVFSVNYFSYIAEVCYRLNIQYICYNVDSPLLNMQHPSINYKTNHIYTFDSKEAKDFNNNGVDTVYYLPLCTNIERVQTLLNSSEKTAHEADNNINNQTTDFFKNSISVYPP